MTKNNSIGQWQKKMFFIFFLRISNKLANGKVVLLLIYLCHTVITKCMYLVHSYYTEGKKYTLKSKPYGHSKIADN